MVNIYYIDLFCGAGGTSTGIHLADCMGLISQSNRSLPKLEDVLKINSLIEKYSKQLS